ncbi:MAG: glycoside hydrolase family 88 protein [Marinoscillum sp.]
MKTNLLIVAVIGFCFVQCTSGKTDLDQAAEVPVEEKITEEFIDNQILSAKAQYKELMKNLPADSMPRTYDSTTGQMINSDTRWWCSGFYPGTLLYLNEFAADNSIKQEALDRLAILEKEKHNATTHDLGFMMYCSFGNADSLTSGSDYSEVLMTSAKSLATRFNSTVGCIRSWDHGPWNYPVIIDNMMNLELLFWATRFSGDSTFYNIAVTHANTTMKNHFREDNSSYHVIDYDQKTGDVIARKTVQGAADSSAWARGQAWGLYGYTVMYRETGDAVYLSQAKKIAAFMLNHPNMPGDNVPYWDYDAPGIPDTYRDASAAAVMASGLLELGLYVDDSLQEVYAKEAAKAVSTLATSEYTAQDGSNGGFILKHSVGSIPHNSEIDVPLTYADYYYVEALLRYKDWYLQ